MKQPICSRCKKRPAMIFISRVDGEKSTPEGLCLKCAMEMNIGPIKQMMESMGITEEDLDAMSEQLGGMFGGENGEDFEPGGAGTFPFMQGLMDLNLQPGEMSETQGDGTPEQEETLPAEAPDAAQQTKTKRSRSKEKKKIKRKYLDAYCTNLTQRAKDGQIDRIIGRDREIYRVVQILCRRTKNNPCLIGEPGVGKTAIAEGLALRMANGEVPARLADKELHLLDLFRGQFESRIKGLIEEVKQNGNIILFIDEVHNLVGTGDAEGSMNAANILKPALSRGEIQVIGATTFNEYRKNIEKDAALERRFQPVKVEEPSIEDTYQMLMGIKSYYENYHHVQISDQLVRRAVVLSERYINDRFLPDKAIDLLDEACTCANLRNKAISDYQKKSNELQELKETEEDLMNDTEEMDLEEISRVRAEIVACESETNKLKPAADDNGVTEDDLANVIQLWTGIPASKVIESDLRRLAGLENTLKSKVIGQDEAVALVSAAIRRSRVQISPRRRPASFIFVGPTGVGKTELVKQLANELFDTPETLIRLDMSEFMEKHSVSRIIGSPPGYVGYDEAGQLTEKVRRKPYSVILFDEVEKAHPDVLNILLQILDDGHITDAQGRNVNFENTVIVMTSNAGSDARTSAGSVGFGRTADQQGRERAMKALQEFLRPEFLNRVDEVVYFHQLTEENFRAIAALMLGELRDSLAEKGLTLSWEDSLLDYLVKKSYSAVYGARNLRRLVQKELEDAIAARIIDSWEHPVTQLHASANGEELCLTAL